MQSFCRRIYYLPYHLLYRLSELGNRRASLIGGFPQPGFTGYLDRQFSVNPDGNQPLVFGPASPYNGTIVMMIFIILTTK